ncbi:AI-2E family transporter [Patescibacteria group bacterium]
MPRKIEISHKTIIFTVFFLMAIWFLYFIRDIILILFIALLIMAILNPLVTRLSKFKVPRALSVLFVYVLVFVIITATIAGVIPALIEQTKSFANYLPAYLLNIGFSNAIGEQLVNELVSQLGTFPAQIVKVGLSIFSNVVALFTVLIIGFYLLLYRSKMGEQLEKLLGKNKGKMANKYLDVLEEKLGGWTRGQLILMVIIGVLTFLGLTILGIPYALPLALLAGILEIVPNIGPTIAAVPAVVIGFGISPLIGLATIAIYILIQQLENYVFVPKVMEKSVGVNPIVTLLVIAVGFKVAGVAGILISVPVYITIQVVVKELYKTVK